MLRVLKQHNPGGGGWGCCAPREAGERTLERRIFLQVRILSSFRHTRVPASFLNSA